MAPRLPELIKRARRLALERDRLVHELAREWTAALRGQGFSPRDLDELWAGLTEEAVRRLLKGSALRASAEAIRREANEVIARVKERIPDSWRNFELQLFEFGFRFAAPGALRTGRKLRRLVDERMKYWG